MTSVSAGRTHLHALQEVVGEGSEVSQGCEAHHEDHEHDGQLEVGVQGSCKDLGGCQCQGQHQHYAVPEPQLWPVSTLSRFAFPSM